MDIFAHREGISMMLLDLINLAAAGDMEGAEKMCDTIDAQIAELVRVVSEAPQGTH